MLSTTVMHSKHCSYLQAFIRHVRSVSTDVTIDGSLESAEHLSQLRAKLVKLWEKDLSNAHNIPEANRGIAALAKADQELAYLRVVANVSGLVILASSKLSQSSLF